MQKIILLVILVTVGALRGNAQNTLIGKWKITAMEKDGKKIPIEENALRTYMYTTTQKEKAEDSIATLTAEDSSNIEMTVELIKKSIGNMQLEFDINKKLTITFAKKKEIETYVYNAAKKQLITTNNKKRTKTFVATIDHNTLILDNSKSGDEGIMYLERIK